MHSEQTPLVSVIMPMNNSERFLYAAIESVISQTFTNWELLVIDDASSDNSLTIAESYARKDKRIHIFKSDHHIGMPSAPRNKGVSMASGRFIAFLDSDDLWKPDKLAQQLPFFEDPLVAIVYSNYEKTNEDGTPQPHRIIRAPKQVTYKQLLMGNIIGNLTGIYDSKKVGKIEIRDIHHEDYVMWLTILKKGFLARNTGTVNAIYRTHKGSVSSDKLRVVSWQWNIYRHLEQLSVIQSTYYYVNYALRALIKSLT